jgi:hypothetical protein
VHLLIGNNTPRRLRCWWAQAAGSFSDFLDLKESLEALFQRSADLAELRAIRNRHLRYYLEQSKSSI